MRIPSIDSFRALGAFAVICIHTRPFLGCADAHGNSLPADCYHLLGLAIHSLSFFAVPFFFVASGFLFARSLKTGLPAGELLLKSTRRIGLVFLIWSLVYALPITNWRTMARQGVLRATYERILSFTDEPLELIFRGTSVPLWFLVSLAIGLALNALVYPRLKNKLFLIVVPIYLLSVLGVACATSQGSFAPFTALRGPLVAPLFVAIGFWFAWDEISLKNHRHYSLLMFACGFMLVLASFALVEWHYNLFGFWILFGAGWVALGAGGMLITLSYPQFGASTILPHLGKYALGVYLSHSLILPRISQLAEFPGTIGQIFLPLATYGTALAISFCLARNKFTRQLVT